MAAMQWCGAMARRIMMTQRTSAALNCSAAKYSSLSPASAAPAVSGMDLCGRGDKKTKKGKRFKGSYGNSRGKKQKMIERIKDKLEVPRSTPWPLPFKLI
ncbi:PREDICTED: 30S ribosomal protein S31, mitochondrial [Camelina sativa]|uniref:30S ribosomal protein S31, mitochondrial n=1 Tax=Camelina sativa TaxID=90675 RepID=A0ABM0SVU5_CAMSA|nr:PREDICTED: 30S ribosomal protein S31, mitochondrial [Camelina sativa]XP_010472108.1 PREDICTED: 30S ribosomal protein S31, mitochondrial [Camelina sativa]